MPAVATACPAGPRCGRTPASQAPALFPACGRQPAVALAALFTGYIVLGLAEEAIFFRGRRKARLADEQSDSEEVDLEELEAEEEDAEDPRAELIRRLQEYERFKQAAEDLVDLPQLGRDVFPTSVEAPYKHIEQAPPDVDLKEVLLALKDVLHRADMFSSHHVTREPLSLRERMSCVLENVNADRYSAFTDLFDIAEGRQGVVVTFMAILELIKQQLIELVQADSFAPIHVKARGG